MAVPESNHKGVSSLASSYAAVVSMDVDVQKGRLLKDKCLLERTVLDIENNTHRRLLYSFHHVNGKAMQPGFPFEIPDKADWFPSPSGEKLCVIRNDDTASRRDGKPGPEDAQSSMCTCIELWSIRDGTLLSRMSPGLTHGKIITKARFGGVDWSQDETTLLYVAHIKDQPGKSFFDERQGNQRDRNDDGAMSQGGEVGDLNLYRDDWGETFSDVHDVGLFLMDLNTGKVVEVPVGKGITPSSPIFSRSGDIVLYTAYECGAVRLGIAYSYLRPCKLYTIDVGSLIEYLHRDEDGSVPSTENVDKGHYCLTQDDKVSLYPRISPCGFDTHHAPLRVCRGVLLEKNVRQTNGVLHELVLDNRSILADYESKPSKDRYGGYTGVWPALSYPVIPHNCWAPDSSAIYVSTLCGSKQTVFKVDASGKGVTRVQLETEGEQQEHCSFTLLDVGYNGLLVSFSSPNSPPSFVVVPFDGNKNNYMLLPGFGLSVIARRGIIGSTSYFNAIHKAVREISIEKDLDTHHSESTHQSSGYPLIVMVHGGPHGNYTARFFREAAYLCSTQRMGILMVNYRGSTGFGNECLNSLPGCAGLRDVQDVLQATLQTLEEEKCIDPKRVCIYGKSHGGFLSCHMSARYPEVYKVAIIVNPVTDIVTQSSGSDIPDWAWTEAIGCGSFDFSRGYKNLDANALCTMWKLSPLAYENGAIGPTLLALGLKDRRVPPTQGFSWYRALKTRGVDIKLLTYKEDGHSLATPASTADVICNAAKWLRDKL